MASRANASLQVQKVFSQGRKTRTYVAQTSKARILSTDVTGIVSTWAVVFPTIPETVVSKLGHRRATSKSRWASPTSAYYRLRYPTWLACAGKTACCGTAARRVEVHGHGVASLSTTKLMCGAVRSEYSREEHGNRHWEHSSLWADGADQAATESALHGPSAGSETERRWWKHASHGASKGPQLRAQLRRRLQEGCHAAWSRDPAAFAHRGASRNPPMPTLVCCDMHEQGC